MGAKARCALGALGLLLAAAVAGAAEYEVPQNRAAKDILGQSALKGQNYRIRDVVIGDGYMHRWTAESDIGAFEAVGDLPLLRNGQNTVYHPVQHET